MGKNKEPRRSCLNIRKKIERLRLQMINLRYVPIMPFTHAVHHMHMDVHERIAFNIVNEINNRVLDKSYDL